MRCTACHHLPLDGVYHTNKILKSYCKNDNCPLTEHVWAHIFGPVQIILVLIETVVTQVIRGVLLILSGVFTCSGHTFSRGVKDIAAVIVQAFALPILALVTFIYPRWGLQLSEKMLEKASLEINTGFIVRNPVRASLIALVIGIISIPISLIKNAISLVNRLISLEFDHALITIPLIFKEIFVNLIFAIGSICAEKYRTKTLYSFSAAYLFSPKPVDEFSKKDNLHTHSFDVVRI